MMPVDMKKASREKRDDYIWRLFSKLSFTPTEIQAIIEKGGYELTTKQIKRVIEKKKETYERTTN